MSNLHLKEVKDMFGLSVRIKDINPNYRLFFNRLTLNYEIHDITNKFSSLCLIIKPNELNASIIRKLHITKREKMKDLFIEIDKNNKKLEDERLEKSIETASDLTSEIINYASHINRDISNNEIKNIIHKLGD